MLMHVDQSCHTTNIGSTDHSIMVRVSVSKVAAKTITDHISYSALCPIGNIVSWASPFTREEGSGQLRIMSLCCRVSSGQAVQGVSSNSMLFAVSHDAVLAGLFGARHTEYACAWLVCVHSTSYYTSMRIICG